MGKVIPTLTNTTYITKILPQNCPKTTSKLPQNFWICSDPSPPPLKATIPNKFKYLYFLFLCFSECAVSKLGSKVRKNRGKEILGT